jgi:phosphomannomutase
MEKKKIFGTSGLRGSLDLFTDEFCFSLGRAFGRFLGKGKKIAIGVDTRSSSKGIKDWVGSGVLAEGSKIFSQGIVSTPAIGYLTTFSDYDGGVEITGSHVKADMNGVKFFVRGRETLKSEENWIRKKAVNVKSKPVKLKFPARDEASKLYKVKLKEFAGGGFSNLKVVLDAGNGTQSKILPELLSELKVEVVKLNCDPKGLFMDRDTETLERFSEVASKVLETGSHLGLIYDLDGDRVVLIDKGGRFLSGDVIGAIISKYIDQDMVVTPINTSSIVDSLGKKVYRTKVGSLYVVEKMEEVGAKFGFEANGGGIFADLCKTRDAGATTIAILKIMRDLGKTLADLTAGFPVLFRSRDKVGCPPRLNKAILQKAREKYKGLRRIEIDGLKIMFDNYEWILFRPSQNAPEFRVFTEAPSQARADELQKMGMALVKKLIGENS